MTKTFEGDIDFWDEKGFGFIKQIRERSRIFFSVHHVLPDWKGSKAWCFSRVPVKFEISSKVVAGGETKTFATNVEPLFEMSEPETISGYRETSEVLNINRKKGFGFLRRPCGDALFFHRKDVVQDFEDRWDFLEVGSPLWHGVKFDGSTGLWRATDLELYSFAELQSFKNEHLQEPAYEEPESESEPEPKPAPLVAAPVEHKSQLLRAENKNKSILELILRRSLVTPSRRRSP